MAPPPIRAFVIFRDDAPPSPTPSSNSLPEIDNALRAASPTPSTGVSAPDKENINPVTGHKAAADLPKTKKRKEGVLSTKAYAPPVVKKSKDLKNARPFITLVTTKGKALPQTSKRGQAPRRTNTSRSHRAPSLPQVNEDQESEPELSNIPENGRLSQAQIDARCYELTVLPLADVSKAYEQAPCLEGEHALAEKVRQQEIQKETVDDAQSGGSERAPSPVPSSESSRSSSPARSEAAFSTFSTPERKRVYSAFTFSSPSPSSVRYAALRSSNETRFSDPTFEL